MTEDTFHFIKLDHIKDICGGDRECMKELMDIFLAQIPVFISNINKYFDEKNSIELAREVHTARSSALIFMMEETGDILKKIQSLAGDELIEDIPGLIQNLELNLNGAVRELSEYILINY
jgi:HPt (histidine-containing phosphotransfer) domain-containing protein